MMKTRVKRAAHFFERLGLAMVGSACGLLVAVQVGSSLPVFRSEGFLLIMMVSGAFGFYLGIDTPPHAVYGQSANPSNASTHGRADMAEFLSAVGTFIAAVAAFASIGLIALRDEPPTLGVILIVVCWVVGVAMQAVAGAITRIRAN